MPKVSLTREKNRGNICLQFTNAGKAALRFLPYQVTSDQWDANRKKVVRHPRADYINVRINGILNQATDVLLVYNENNPTRGVPPSVLRDKVCAILFHEDEDCKLFLDIWNEFEATKVARTRELYILCRKTMCAYDNRLKTRKIDDINLSWLQGLIQWLKPQQKTNTTNIRLRCIRAVFNYALRMEYTTRYPFRNLKIKQDPIIRHDLTPEQIELLMTAPVPPMVYNGRPIENYIQSCRTMFWLIGINAKDLWQLGEENIINGRVKYIRAKTHKVYSIKLIPPAENALQDTILLARVYSTHRDYMVALNRCLRVFCAFLHIPPITTNWLRHSWATYAQNKCHIPLDIIAQALGHSSMLRVTEGYPATDVHNADEANIAVWHSIFGKDSV